mgnify:CR=1 FL=1
MLKNPEDRRVRRSRKLLKQSLLELMKEKSFSDISVRDIAEGADMNRGTFYLHYSGTTELLRSIEADLLEELQALIDAHMQETVADGTVRPVLEPLLDFAVSHRETFAVLFAGSETSGFIQSLQQLICRSGAALVNSWFRPRDESQTVCYLSFLTWGAVGLLKEWFAQDMAMPREELLAAAQRMAEGSAAGLFSAGPE